MTEHQGSPRVLLVEDDSALAELYRVTLVEAGWGVDVEPNGASGLEHIRTAAPDILLLDLGLPDIDGLEVLQRVRGGTDRPDLPVVVLTNSLDETQRQSAEMLGVLAWLIKVRTTREQLPGILQEALARAAPRRAEPSEPITS